MKKHSLMMAFSIVLLTGCGVENRINRSTCEIQRNTAAIERSTEAIERNLAELEKISESQ